MKARTRKKSNKSKNDNQVTREVEVMSSQESVSEAEKMVGRLVGFGERFFNLDGCRLRVPRDLLNVVGGRSVPWIAIAVENECVRLIPRFLWCDYLSQMREEYGRSFPTRAFAVFVEQKAVKLVVDRAGRWDFKKHHIVSARLCEGTSSEVVLIANRFWVEVWGRSNWDGLMLSLRADAKNSPPSQGLPPTSSANH